MSYWVDDWYWQMWDNNAAPEWMPWFPPASGGVHGFYAAFVVLAIRSPSRSLHDCLAGTYLVITR
jgi:hypothetical protein